MHAWFFSIKLDDDDDDEDNNNLIMIIIIIIITIIPIIVGSLGCVERNLDKALKDLCSKQAHVL